MASLVERELPVLLECLRSPQFFVGHLLLNFSVSFLCRAFVDHIFFFLFGPARSVLLRAAPSDYPIGIFKYFSHYIVMNSILWGVVTGGPLQSRIVG